MFQIHPLPAAAFSCLNDLSEEELAERAIQIHVSDGSFPCRVSLADATAGERVFLLNFEHQPHGTPYRASHAIFVRENAQESRPEPGVIPQSIASRLLSVRAFNRQHEIIDADVVEGTHAAELISAFFANPDTGYIHLHFARRGCFAAKVTRAGR
ncbi:DUF1203 domain-containing protein [Labrenzia sp. 011]|uniref:DUF1203 domain-containing protein n=1 Tax=Labrenzia sp. 011 TaxID=2171494 RepID=UPI000D50C576|nr:DUF1203 domain-containing protein [Labrenzia sp. 011]PVB60051.1 DUF1203 domain-containing protein [Labrenzia sp. 011]